MEYKTNYAIRVLMLYHSLSSGRRIKKADYIMKHNIGSSTFDRDIDTIRTFLSEIYSSDEVIYDRLRDVYYMERPAVLARSNVDEASNKSEPRDNVKKIIEEVSDYYKVSMSDLLSKKKSVDVTYPKKVAIYLMVNLAKCSWREVGLLFKTDHATIAYARKYVANAIENNESIREDVDILSERLSCMLEEEQN